MKTTQAMEANWSIASVTVTWNPGVAIEGHMQALRRQSRPLDEIIVVDNASTDGTLELLKRDFPEVKVIALSQNTGVGGGFSAGLKYAFDTGHDWIWLFDHDSLPRPDALEKLVAAIQKQSHHDCKLGVVASLPVNPENGLPYFGCRWKDRFVPVSDMPEELCHVDSTTSSGSLIRREVVEGVGLPRRDFFIDFVDHEYNLRIRRHGYDIAMVPGSVMYHTIGKTRVHRFLGRPRLRIEEQAWRQYYMARNETYTVCHELPGIKAKGFLLWRMLRTILDVLIFNSQKALRMKMICLGIWDGLTSRLGIRALSS